MLRRGHWTSRASAHAAFAAIVWRGNSLPHARQDRQASSVRRPLEGRQRPKKPGPSLLQVASPVWRGAPVCLRLPVFSRAVDWPLVQIPADRHTTTGTCVLGKPLFGRIGYECKNFFAPSGGFSKCRQMSSQARRRARPNMKTAPDAAVACEGCGGTRSALGQAKENSHRSLHVSTPPNICGPRDQYNSVGPGYKVYLSHLREIAEYIIVQFHI